MSADRMSDDELLERLRARLVEWVARGDLPGAPFLPASAEDIARTESRLGFHLPPRLRRLYEIANGGIGLAGGFLLLGDGEDTLEGVYRRFVDSTHVPGPGEPRFAQYPWPERLLPILEWRDAWSCLDCRSADGPVVTALNGQPFANTGHTLHSWLAADLDGVDLFEEMCEPGPTRMAVNPFTKQPLVIRGRGKPRGTRWP